MTSFPKGFVWGAATSAYQIEGGCQAGGRGPSIWDAFTAIPGKTHQGNSGQPACDHYHHFREDVALMRAMGLKAYRFSISWPRLLPKGRQAINLEGIDFYSRLIDELLDNEIDPWATLYHWDLPLALQLEKDGWLNPDMARYYAEYADLCFEYFGDRVKHWITINEAWVLSILGYAHGIFAPGRVSLDEPYRVGHNLLLAHAAAVEVYREKYQHRQNGYIGIANNCDWREPASASQRDHAAAQRALEFFLGWFADPIYKGRYPESMVSRLGERLPKFTAEQVEGLKNSTDFFGLNHYTTMLASHCDDPSSETSYLSNIGIAEDQDIRLSLDPDWALTAMQWGVAPWGCRKLLHWIDARYDHPPIVLTENGCAFDDELENGMVNDQRRIDFLSGYIKECQRAITEGVDLRGYFLWSFMDNFEWASGYSKRFGIHHVDFATQTRTPKASAKWYAEVIGQNCLP
jgi:beta-glucosidase